MNLSTPEACSDLVLLHRYRYEHDMDAFHHVMHRHQGELLRLAHALLGDADAAQDAVQECFLRLVREADGLIRKAPAGRDSIGGWLCTVLRNHCLDTLRRRRLVRFFNLGDGEQAPPAIAAPHPPAAAPASDDTGALLWREVAGLPPLERAAVLLRYRDDLSYQDIAERLGKTATHIGLLLHQGLARLRESRALCAEALP